MSSIKELVYLMTIYTSNKCEIATLVAKNQNAPKYLYTEASDALKALLYVAQQLDDKINDDGKNK